MFGITTSENISDELLNTYAAWDEYVSHVWYNFFYFFDLNRNSTVVEVAPGFSPKIGMALRKIDYAGNIFVIEPNRRALDAICEKYKVLLPDANIHPVDKKLADACYEIPKNYDFLVSNHPLDDILISNNELENKDCFFSWTHADELVVDDLFKSTWDNLLLSPEKINKISEKIVCEWIFFIKRTSPKKIILSQYPSLVLANHHLQSLNIASLNVLLNIESAFKKNVLKENVQKILNGHKNYNFDFIANGILNARAWMLCENE